MAGVLGVYSNLLELPLTPEELQKLAVPGDREEGLSTPATYQAHGLSRRLGPKKVADAIRRYEAGESARSVAEHFGVATSALVTLLRDNAVVVRKRRITDTEARSMAKEYDAGATIRELQAKYELSQGGVSRALHRVGVKMRPSKPRQKAT